MRHVVSTISHWAFSVLILLGMCASAVLTFVLWPSASDFLGGNGYTSLSLVTPTSLPLTLKRGVPSEFSFQIENHTGHPQSYTYVVLLETILPSAQVSATRELGPSTTIVLDAGERVVVPIHLSLADPPRQGRIRVQLTGGLELHVRVMTLTR